MSNNELSFEVALSEIDQVVHDLEDGQIGLEQSLERYERGVGLLKHCYGLLQKAEQRILLLTGVDCDGQPLTKPFTISPEDDGSIPRKSPPMRRTATKECPPETDGAISELF